MSVELLCVMVTITLLLLVSTGLPFLVQVMVTGPVLDSTKHSSELVAPAMRGKSMLFNDTLTFSAINENAFCINMILHNLTWNQACPKAHSSSRSVSYTVTSNHCVVVCGILLQVTQCDSVGGIDSYDIFCTTDSVALCKVSVSLLTSV